MNKKIKIIEYTSSKAKQKIIHLINTKKNELFEWNEYLQQFISESYFVKCYVVENQNHEIISFCLLRKNDFDPYKNNSTPQFDPYTLCFIYTFLNYRRQNYAYNLLTHIKIKEEITAFCNNIDSIMLFNKADYFSLGYDQSLAIYRTK